MSLSTTLDVARSSLSVTGDRSAIVSRNIAHAGDPLASRKLVQLVTDTGGAPRLSSITRSVTDALQAGVIAATSDGARRDVLVAAMDRLEASVGDPQNSTSPATQIGKLTAALQTYATQPTSSAAGQAVLSAADELVSSLNGSAKLVDQARTEADADIQGAVTRLNNMLGKIEGLNARIMNTTRTGGDATDDLDARDKLVAGIAEQVGITVLNRGDNAIALYTDSGLTLFDGRARQVMVQPTPLVSGQPGAAIMIDGVPATGQSSVMAIMSGRLAGLVEFRDSVALTYGNQLDEIARGLITAFAESDQSATPTLPDAAGLFHVPGSTLIPAAGTAAIGLASSIAVNPNADPARGGTIERLRDGGISNPGNPAYIYNAASATGFSDRIDQLVIALSDPIAFDAAAQLGADASVSDFAANSVGWLHGQRQASNQEAEYARAVLQRSSDALSKVSGINIDDELTQLLELERTYQASSKLIATVDSMFSSLLQAVGR
jgi:flagellar hook-associated protein 1